MPLELFNVGINLNFNLKELGIRLTQVATIYSISSMFSNLGKIPGTPYFGNGDIKKQADYK